ncbi:MAG: ComEC/Rec2 family competence protein [Gemmataceae bacterium]
MLLTLLLFAAPGLDVHYIDTEGGAATLIVTPAGESVLIDCGNPGKRDAERIADGCKKAGLKQIDHLIITHWHLDHYGSAGPLAKLIPIKSFHDRGIPDTLDEDRANFPLLIRAYKEACGGKSNTLKAGDTVALKQADGAPKVELLCVCASGKVIAERPGAKPNPVAADHKPMKPDPTDNAQSLGFVLSFGGWRFLDLGDLTWNVEAELVSPSDRLGPIDVYQSTHHGLEVSNNPVVIRTVGPRVAVFNNGPRKGGHPNVVRALQKVPGIEGIYQMHRNLNMNAENADADRIANDGRKKESGAGIVVKVAADAKTYTVTVGRTGKTFTHKTRAGG